MTSFLSRKHVPPPALPLAYPLDDFYAQQGLALPQIEAIEGDQMPQPYRSLLVHEKDMTPTLEAYHQDIIHLDVLRHQERGDFLFREVILILDGNLKKVEFGAIKINLSLFSPEARRLVLAQHLPLGTILKQSKMAHMSKPRAFVRVRSDAFINQSLGLSETTLLYGRRNRLFQLDQQTIAETIEILPPHHPDHE